MDHDGLVKVAVPHLMGTLFDAGFEIPEDIF
jgi:hypothetical protein